MRKSWRRKTATATTAAAPYSLKHGAARPALITAALAAVLLATVPLTKSEAVINGNTPSVAPSWTVFLHSTTTNSKCSGVLISSNLVLSARHCIDGKMDHVMIGRSDLHNEKQGAHVMISSYEGYSRRDDIAVFELWRPVSQRPVKISTEDIHLAPQTVTLFGYGSNKDFDTEFSNDWKLHSVDGISSPCPEAKKTSLNPSEFCLLSKNQEQAPCDGDSGAPITNQAGELGAVIHAVRPHETIKEKRCVPGYWVATSVIHEPVRKWVDEMIAKYQPHDEL